VTGILVIDDDADLCRLEEEAAVRIARNGPEGRAP
jgi:hypothetical protein